MIENAGIFGMYIGIPLCDYNRASPKLDITVRPLCPTLSVSDAEHGVTHDSCTSGTAAFRAASLERNECDEKLDNVKMQAWRACGTRLTPPCRSRLGGVETENKLTMS